MDILKLPGIVAGHTFRGDAVWMPWILCRDLLMPYTMDVALADRWIRRIVVGWWLGYDRLMVDV
jgi:hypothetical protein